MKTARRPSAAAISAATALASAGDELRMTSVFCDPPESPRACRRAASRTEGGSLMGGAFTGLNDVPGQPGVSWPV